MKKRVGAVFCALLLALSLFSGCSEDSFNLAWPVYENVRTLDPQYASSSTAKLIAVNCFEGLVRIGEDGSVQPAAAESYEKNGLTYRFTLRSGAVWKLSSTAEEGMSGKIPADFSPAVTAHDFVFAFRRLCDPATGAPDAYLFRSILNFSKAMAGEASPESIGVRAESDTVLIITLSQEDPQFLQKLAEPCAVPCNEEFFTACGGRYGLMTMYMLTNGPFYFSRWNTDESFRMTKSDIYNGPTPATPDTVWLYLNDDVGEMNRKLAEGVYGAGITGNAAFDPATVEKELTAEPISNMLYSLIFNCQSTVPAVKSLRTALLASWNPSFFEAEGKTLSQHLLPENIALPGGVSKNSPPVFSESDAKASLGAALLALDTENTEITILCEPEYESALKNQMQQWQRILGVSLAVRVEAVARTDLMQRVEDGDFEAAFYPLRAKSSTAADFLATFTSSSKENVTGYASVEYDALFEQVSAASGEQALVSAIDGALEHLAQNAVYMPVYVENSYFICQNDISGIVRGNSETLIYFAGATRS